MKIRMLKSHWKEEGYSDHWDNGYRVDTQNKAVGREKKNIQVANLYPLAQRLKAWCGFKANNVWHKTEYRTSTQNQQIINSLK